MMVSTMRQWNYRPSFLLLGALIIGSATGWETSSGIKQSPRNQSVENLGKLEVLEKPTQANYEFFNDSIDLGESVAKLSNRAKVHTKLRVRRIPVTTARKVMKFDHLVLVQHYVPILCYERKLKYIERMIGLEKEVNLKNARCMTDNQPKEPNIWTIHGLWPAKERGLLINCDEENELTGGDVTSFEKELKTMWPDVYLTYSQNINDRDAYGFWKHEWEKHGTCAASSQRLNSIKGYFEETMKLFEQYNMKIATDKKQYVQGDTPEKYIELMNHNLVFKAKGRITCYKHAGKQYLKEVELCFVSVVGEDGVEEFEIRNCTQPRIRNCDENKVILHVGWSPFRDDLFKRKKVADDLASKAVLKGKGSGGLKPPPRQKTKRN